MNPQPNQPSPPDPNDPNPNPRPQPQPCAEAPTDFGSYLKESPLSDAEKLVIAERETAILEEDDQREESVIKKLAVFEKLADRANVLLLRVMQGLHVADQVEEWMKDYSATR